MTSQYHSRIVFELEYFSRRYLKRGNVEAKELSLKYTFYSHSHFLDPHSLAFLHLYIHKHYSLGVSRG